MKDLSPAEIAAILAPYYPTGSRRLSDQIGAYISLLLEWNQKISLTAVTDPVEIVKFHFGESLFAASALETRDGRLADVGSGAGFPGIPLAMAIPGMQATLIESNAKKAAFLSEAARRLQLSNVSVVRSRMEDVAQIGAFDFICARAMGKHASLMRWSSGKLTQRGRLVLFLGERDAQQIRQTSGWNWELPVRIPGSSRRCILSATVAP
jgi:16S rRNA (guanine527-N7)-methyltransferase